MNIPEWQSKMIRSTPKSLMKHAMKQLEMMQGHGDNGIFKEELKNSVPTRDDKKSRRVNIDALTGKRKYTRKIFKLDGVHLASKSLSHHQIANYSQFVFRAVGSEKVQEAQR